MTIAYLPQTTVDTMARIAAGVDPWIAFRDFLEDWTYLPASRAGLAARRPPFANGDQRRWAALLAAAIEVLCARDGLVPPGWTREPAFRLDEAWYLYEGTGRIRDWLRETTPPAFASATSGAATDSCDGRDGRLTRVPAPVASRNAL